ncbi:MAG: hypothetical protein RLZZ501_2712 [Pseudomonadota bacterium]|jgi:hypothetical protein
MAFEQTVRLLRAASPEAFRAYHAKVAKRELARYLAEAGDKPEIIRYVDGREGAAEESVRFGGVIRYEFVRIARIARDALDLARDLSPVRSGRYREAWFLMVDGAEVDANAVRADARQITLTNDQPYHRKLEMTVNQGARGPVKVSVRKPPGICEAVRQRLLRKYGQTFTAQVTFIELAGGYVLKGDATRAAKASARSSVHRAGGTRTRARKGRRAGDAMTYPALVLSIL